MRESTAQWLNPMLDASRERGIDTTSLMAQASMPAAEAVDLPWSQFLQEALPDARHSAIDWIRFGELLRDELGWDNYPQWPEPGR